MHDLKEEYVDGIAQIHFVNGMVRIDLARAEPQEGRDKPELQIFERVILSPQGFLNSLAIMQQLADKLADNGVLQRRDIANDSQ